MTGRYFDDCRIAHPAPFALDESAATTVAIQTAGARRALPLGDRPLGLLPDRELARSDRPGLPIVAAPGAGPENQQV